MEDNGVQYSTLFTTLPAEIIAEVLSNLSKEDVKNVRLVCHYFEGAAVPLLYDRIVLSQQEPNFAPFDSIISTPKLSKRVKTLTYDMQWFDDLRSENYIVDLFHQLHEDLISRLADDDASTLSSQLRATVERVNWFQLRARATSRYRQSNLLEWWEDVERGYRAYHAHRTRTYYTESSISNRQRITTAFANCPNLRQVEMCGSWECYPQPISDDITSLLPRYHSSGLLARHWHPFWLRPRSPGQDYFHRMSLVEDMFDIIHDSGKQIDHLIIGNGCEIGPDMHVVPTSMHVDMPFLFRSLTSLSLDVPVNPSVHPFYYVEYLFSALQAAQNLKHLIFNGRNNSIWHHADDMRWDFSNRFPHSTLILPRLVSLHLGGMRGLAHHYFDFLNHQPQLKCLHLQAIDLVPTTEPIHEDWVYLIEGLRRIQKLNDFSLRWPLRTGRNCTGWSCQNLVPHEEDWPNAKVMLERYVLHVGANPFFHVDGVLHVSAIVEE
ncbi:MAG: hypothetical protein L6R39_005761 [Caloplaca ligustica]|nr:MAG: hypothetical protein L6R39_005761 [Caloplaca ligustica]